MWPAALVYRAFPVTGIARYASQLPYKQLRVVGPCSTVWNQAADDGLEPERKGTLQYFIAVQMKPLVAAMYRSFKHGLGVAVLDSLNSSECMYEEFLGKLGF